MPQITTIRVVRRRSVQPEQFGNAAAEVELTGNVLEGEDYKAVARQMLIDSRELVYENIGMKLPASAVAQAKEVDTPTETASVTVTPSESEDEEPKRRGRGRPKGSKNTLPKKGTKAAEEHLAAAEAAKPQISANPEDRVNPEDDIPEDDEQVEYEASSADSGDPVDDLPEETGDKGGITTAEELHQFMIGEIKAKRLTAQQGKQVQVNLEVVRTRDIKAEDVPKAVAMVNEFIKQNEGVPQ